MVSPRHPVVRQVKVPITEIKRLEAFKVHPRQAYWEVIKMLIDNEQKRRKTQ